MAAAGGRSRRGRGCGRCASPAGWQAAPRAMPGSPLSGSVTSEQSPKTKGARASQRRVWSRRARPPLPVGRPLSATRMCAHPAGPDEGAGGDGLAGCQQHLSGRGSGHRHLGADLDAAGAQGGGGPLNRRGGEARQQVLARLQQQDPRRAGDLVQRPQLTEAVGQFAGQLGASVAAAANDEVRWACRRAGSVSARLATWCSTCRRRRGVLVVRSGACSRRPGDQSSVSPPSATTGVRSDRAGARLPAAPSLKPGDARLLKLDAELSARGCKTVRLGGMLRRPPRAGVR